MSIEAAIHAWWADATDPLAVALNTLLPVTRLVSGVVQDADLKITDGPFATLSRDLTQTAFSTNCGDGDRSPMLLQIWHENYDEGEAIKDAAIACFHRKKRASAGIIQALRASDTAIQEPDGWWQFPISFEVLHTQGA